jgi:hypothetical protein
MAGKSASSLPDIKVREAVAVFLYGPGYTNEQLRTIAVWKDGRWYKYPFRGTYKIRRGGIHVERTS